MRKALPTVAIGMVAMSALARSEERELQVLERARHLAEERGEIEEELIAILKEDSTDKKVLERQGKAVELLGRMGTAKAVPALVAVVRKYFEPTPPGVRRTGEVVVAEHSEGYSPPTRAMHALAALGPLSVEALLETYAKESHPCLRSDKQQAVLMLPCKKLVIALAKKRLEEEKGAEIRDRLLGLLCFLGEDEWVQRFHPAWVAALRAKGWKCSPEAAARRQPQAEQPERAGKPVSPFLVLGLVGGAAFVALAAWAFLRHRAHNPGVGH